MPSAEKLFIRIKNNPKDVRFSELCKVLEWDGWILHTQNSSHYTYFKRGKGRVTIVKRDDKVLPCYVKKVLEMMEAQ